MTDGFGDFYMAHWRPVVATLRVVTGDAEQAEDAAAEAFTRALARWSSVSRLDEPAAWVYKVALNEVRSRWRRKAPERRALARLAAGTDLEYEPAVPDHGLWQAVAALPDRMRMATALRYVADLPEAEVAALMGVTRGTVASTLHDARQRLALTAVPADQEDS